MNKLNRKFFIALNNETKNINLNNLTLDQVVYAYNKLSKRYSDFIKSQEGTHNYEKSKLLNEQYDKIYKFWINNFNIALRNEIGKTRPEQKEFNEVDTGIEDRAVLTEDTVKKIKSEHFIKISSEAYNKTSLKNIKHIFNRIIQNNTESDINNIKPKSVLNGMLNEIETYTFKTGVTNIIDSYIKKYSISFEIDGIKYEREFYGDIQLARFTSDSKYSEAVLESIENLNFDNFYNNRNNKYLGIIGQSNNNDTNIWNIEYRHGDIDAINKIEAMKKNLEKNDFDKGEEL